MALPTLLTGEMPDATKWATILSYLPVGAIKTSNQIKNNTSAFGNDNELAVSLVANATYVGEVVIYYNSGTTPDFKAKMTLPSGASGQWGGCVYNLGSALVTFGTNDITVGTSIGGLASEVSTVFTVLIVTSSTAGTAQLQWAQNTATVADTTVYANSYIKLNRIA